MSSRHRKTFFKKNIGYNKIMEVNKNYERNANLAAIDLFNLKRELSDDYKNDKKEVVYIPFEEHEYQLKKLLNEKNEINNFCNELINKWNEREEKNNLWISKDLSKLYLQNYLYNDLINIVINYLN